jgi:hypothetical protein
MMIYQPNQRQKQETAILAFVAAAVALNLFFTALKMINLSNLTYYYWFKPQLISIVIFSPLIDQIIWGATLILVGLIVLLKNMHNKTITITMIVCLPTLVLLLFLQTFFPLAVLYGIFLSFILTYMIIWRSQSFSVSRQLTTAAILTSLSCIALCLEAASLSTWTLNLFVYSPPFAQLEFWRFAIVDLQMFSILNSALPWLFLAFLTSWLWLPCLKFLESKISLKLEIAATKKLQLSLPKPSEMNRKTLILILLATVALAVFVAYYPTAHFSSSILLGTDSTYYYSWINELSQKGPMAAFEMDRPFSNLLLYSIQALTAVSTEVIVRVAPMFCSAALCLVVFWFVSVGTKNKRLALISALLTVFSFQTTVSLFVYSLSNWIAIIEMFLIFGLLLMSNERNLLKSTVVLSLLGVILLLTHPYTWEVAIAILATYLIYAIAKTRSVDKQKIKQLTVFLTTNFAFFVVYSMMPFGSGLLKAGGAVFNYALPNGILPNLLNLQSSFDDMVKVWVGGLFANPLLIILAIVGVFAFLDHSKRYNRLMTVWLAVPFAALFAFSPGAFFYYRVVYLIPIQIFAASGLCLILNELENVVNANSQRLLLVLKVLIVVLVVAFLLNYSLRASDVIPLHILSD